MNFRAYNFHKLFLLFPWSGRGGGLRNVQGNILFTVNSFYRHKSRWSSALYTSHGPKRQPCDKHVCCHHASLDMKWVWTCIGSGTSILKARMYHVICAGAVCKEVIFLVPICTLFTQCKLDPITHFL